MRRKIVFIVALFWTALVTTFSLISIGDVGTAIPIPYKDKYVHFLFYFIFVSLWYFYFSIRNPNPKNKIIIVLSAISFGVLMEWCQGAFTATRTPDIVDVIANSVGALFGLLFITSIIRHKTK